MHFRWPAQLFVHVGSQVCASRVAGAAEHPLKIVSMPAYASQVVSAPAQEHCVHASQVSMPAKC